ncbi:MAG: lytic transglycosylase domain-containing protein [Deltaproteobacteria bacterium]|nr:lytic transglycosylase domain-containing protein [Deltaproteobacteria bacterium]
MFGLIALLALFCLSGEAVIFKIFNPDGSITFTTSKPKKNVKYSIFTGSGKFSVIKVPKSSSFPAKTVMSSDILHLIRTYAKVHNLDPNLVKAIIKAESNFNPMAISHKGAMGLMQLMPETADFLNIKNAFDLRSNIYGGTKYLRYLLDRFENDVIHALAAYNAGPENVVKYNGVPPFPETRRFIRAVMHYWRNLT